MAKKKKNDPQEMVGFEEALAELESIVQALEEGQIGLAEAMARYEQGAKILKQCYKLLADAERRIALVSGLDADGNAVLEDFQEREVALEERVIDSRHKSKGLKRPAGDTPGQAGDAADDQLF